MKRVGFIGLGIMGRPMAENVLKAGFPLTVYNRSRPPVDYLASKGANPANSSKEVAENSDVVITCLPDSPDVEKVILGENGVIEGVREGMIVADMSTISPIVTRRIAKELEKRGVKMLDAPVSGGDKGAREGTLTIMVGGDKDAFDECLPIFQAMGKKISYMGKSGNGQLTKLANQIIVGLNMLAVCEGLTFAAKAGLDLEKVLDAVSAGAASSWALVNLGPKIIRRDFTPGFKVKLLQKDLRILLSFADEEKISLLGISLVHELYNGLEAYGKGEDGHQALITIVEKLSQIKVGYEY
jgi:2-hydroxy-3-oxopropionate reductase